MLTEHERQFMDLFLREGSLHDYEGRALRASWARGIVYEHYVKLYPFYEETWRTRGSYPITFLRSRKTPIFVVPGIPKKGWRLGLLNWNLSLLPDDGTHPDRFHPHRVA